VPLDDDAAFADSDAAEAELADAARVAEPSAEARAAVPAQSRTGVERTSEQPAASSTAARTAGDDDSRRRQRRRNARTPRHSRLDRPMAGRVGRGRRAGPRCVGPPYATEPPRRRTPRRRTPRQHPTRRRNTRATRHHGIDDEQTPARGGG
jgi:hypothetical protein